MKRISSKSTFYFKRIFPAIWFGFLGFIMLIPVFMDRKYNTSNLMIFIIPMAMAVFGYFILKKLVFDLIDEVYDEGVSLLFKNRGKEVRVYLRDIKNVSYATINNPPKVTLNLRYKTEFGDELSFSPPMTLIPFKKNPLIVELIDRIDQAKTTG